MTFLGKCARARRSVIDKKMVDWAKVQAIRKESTTFCALNLILNRRCIDVGSLTGRRCVRFSQDPEIQLCVVVDTHETGITQEMQLKITFDT